MEIPWRRKWQPTPVFLPGELRGQRSLAGYSPWGRKESDRTERLNFTFHFGPSITLRPIDPPRGSALKACAVWRQHPCRSWLITLSDGDG